MSERTLNFINFEKYFTLLHGLIPASAGFAFCDISGVLVAASCDTAALITGDIIDLKAFKPINNSNHSCKTYLSIADACRALVSRPVKL